MNKGQKYISIILMLLVVMLFQFIQLSTMHYHKMASGRIIHHSHLYNKSPDSNQSSSSQHSHSRADFLLLQSFDASTIDDILFELDIIVPNHVLRGNYIQEPQHVATIKHVHIGLRAPPFA